jgi:hypothetical protein
MSELHRCLILRSAKPVAAGVVDLAYHHRTDKKAARRGGPFDVSLNEVHRRTGPVPFGPPQPRRVCCQHQMTSTLPFAKQRADHVG